MSVEYRKIFIPTNLFSIIYKKTLLKIPFFRQNIGYGCTYGRFYGRT